jgi:hypothetical protein
MDELEVKMNELKTTSFMVGIGKEGRVITSEILARDDNELMVAADETKGSIGNFTTLFLVGTADAISNGLKPLLWWLKVSDLVVAFVLGDSEQINHPALEDRKPLVSGYIHLMFSVDRSKKTTVEVVEDVFWSAHLVHDIEAHPGIVHTNASDFIGMEKYSDVGFAVRFPYSRPDRLVSAVNQFLRTQFIAENKSNIAFIFMLSSNDKCETMIDYDDAQTALWIGMSGFREVLLVAGFGNRMIESTPSNQAQVVFYVGYKKSKL